MNSTLQAKAERIAARLDSRALEMAIRMDTPCGRGWVGTKPGCKRKGKESSARKPEPEQRQVEPEPKKTRATKGRSPLPSVEPEPKPEPEKAKRSRSKAVAEKVTPQEKQSAEFHSEAKAIAKTEDLDGTTNRSQDIITTGQKGEKIKTTIVTPDITGKAHNTDNLMYEATGGRKEADTVLGLATNANRIVQVHNLERQAGRVTKVQQAAALKHAIESHAKEGDLVIMTARRVNEHSDFGIKKNPISSVMRQPFPGARVLVGKVENGKLRPLTDAEIEHGKIGEKVRQARNAQFEHGVGKVQEAKAGYGSKSLQDHYDKEDAIAAIADKAEDKWLGRKPTEGSVKGPAYYKDRASQWAKEQGFDDSGVNGFTAEATKAHDIGHPVTHDALGMGSKEIHKAFGSIKQKNGKPSLLGEEAIVNVMEHLSRGDSLENSILSGIRVARVLSRNKDHETDEGRKAVRSNEFRRTLTEMAEKMHKNDNFNQYAALVRRANRVSGTVTMAGNDFSRTADGG